jgi:HEAT repeat protein
VVVALGRVGEPAVPHLIGCLKDSENVVRLSAVDALRGVGAAGQKAVPMLSDMALQDSYAIARRNAVLAIAAIEPDKLTDLFARVKKHQDEKVRLSAYQALSVRTAKKGGVSMLPAKLALAPLLDATKDSSANVRVVGLQGLGVLGAAANEAVPAVTALLKDPDARVRSQAQLALKQIKGK